MRFVAVGVSAVLLCGFAVPFAGADTVNPVAGPPGTVVTVSDLGYCVPTAGDQPMMAFGSLDGTSASDPVPFTPPSGTIVVPNVPDGLYRIWLGCGAGEAFVEFTVAPVVVLNPNFTG